MAINYRNQLVTIALLLCVLTGAGVLQADVATPTAPIKEYSVQRILGAITVDGVLDETSWLRARSTGEFVVYPTLNSPRSTEAKILWDDERLYIAVTATDTDIRATRKIRDDDIFAEDCIEFFIMEQQYGEKHHHFLEYQVNALGTMTDAYNIGVYQGVAGWDSKGWRCAVKVDGTINNDTDVDKGWTLEMSIPFFDLYALLYRTEQQTKVHAGGAFKPSAPRPGDRWRANLYRLKYLKGGTEYSAWSPNRPPQGFHDLERFGVLHFTDGAAGTSKS